MSSPFSLYQCPHCEGMIQIYDHERNCRIFRHGVFKHDGWMGMGMGMPIPPHSKKEDCDAWVLQGQIYGCGKPFRLTDDNHVVACEYV